MEVTNMAHNTIKNHDLISSVPKEVRILIAERNPVDVAIAEKLLGLLNYQNIVVTNSGNEAIKLFSTVPFDLVIVGTDLPDLSEIEVCHQLRTIYPDKYIPIIAYTAFGEELKPEILNTVFDDFLFKLTGLEDFMRVIQSVFLKNHSSEKSAELLT